MTPFKKCYNQDFEKKTDRQNNAVAVYNNVFYLVRMGLRFWRLNDKHWQITLAACSLDAFRFLTVQILIHAIKRNGSGSIGFRSSSSEIVQRNLSRIHKK